MEGKAFFLFPSFTIRATSFSKTDSISEIFSRIGQPDLFTLVEYKGYSTFFNISKSHKSLGHLKAVVPPLISFTIMVKAPGHFFNKFSGITSFVYL